MYAVLNSFVSLEKMSLRLFRFVGSSYETLRKRVRNNGANGGSYETLGKRVRKYDANGGSYEALRKRVRNNGANNGGPYETLRK
jgi:hypothetical protein